MYKDEDEDVYVEYILHICVHSNANIFYSYALYLRILILKLYVRLRRERVVDMPRGHLHLYPRPFRKFTFISLIV